MSKSRKFSIPGTSSGSKYVFTFNDKQQLEGIKKQTQLGRPLRSIDPDSAEWAKVSSSSQAKEAYNVNKYKGDYKGKNDDIEFAPITKIKATKTRENTKNDNAQDVDNNNTTKITYATPVTTAESSETKMFAYPLDINLNQDHLKITRYEYRRETLNASFPEGTQETDAFFDRTNPDLYKEVKGGSVLGTLKGSVILPMPKATDVNAAEWGKSELNIQGLAALGLANTFTGQPASTEEEKKERNQAFKEYRDQRGNNEFGPAMHQGSGAIYNQIAAKMAGALLGTELNADTLLARKGGVVLNPNAEMLFQGPAMRDFAFKYRMVARSQKEGEAIRKLIKFLKLGMAPKFRSSTYLKSPDVFTLQYRNGPKEANILKTVNRFSPGGLALTSLSTDYAPNTYWSAYHDSQPVEITVDMSFAELRPIYQQDQLKTPEDSVGY